MRRRSQLIAVAAATLVFPASAMAGDGTFTDAPAVDVGASPYDVAVGDFNEDGSPDFVTENYNANNASVRLGGADGSFTDGADVALGTNPDGITVADFNADGHTDFAASNQNGPANIVSVRLGAGNGTFTSAADVTLPANSHPYAIAGGDLNNDGNEDLIVANSVGATVSIRLGAGNGTFANTGEVAVGAAPISIAVDDLNADGNEDLAIANRDSEALSIRLGNGSGGFTNAADVPVGTGPFASPFAIAAGDFNGDTDPDLAIVSLNQASVDIRLGAAGGTFTNAAGVSTGISPVAIAGGDFNSDGRDDLAIAGGSKAVVRHGAGDGAFTPGADLSGLANDTKGVSVADFDSDGTEDLAIAGQGASSTVAIRLGGGKPRLAGNLLVNGGFEGAAAARLFTASPEPAIPGWSRTGRMTFARYGIPQSRIFPSISDSARFEGGQALLTGGGGVPAGTVSSASQTVDVAAKAASIDAGLARANLSAQLGGASIYQDRMEAKATFIDAAGSERGSFTVGPVSVEDRNQRTTLLRRAGSGVIPAGTRRIRVTLTARDDDADAYDSAAADNVKLTLDAPEPPPASAALPARFGSATLVSLKLAKSRIPAKGPLPVVVTNRNRFAVTGSLAGKSGKSRRGRIGAKKLRVPAGAKRTVKLKLPKALRRTLTRRGKLAIKLTAKVKDPAGRTRTVKKTVKPKLKRARR